MPPKRKATAKKAARSQIAEPSSTALQPTSCNPLKRQLNSDFGKENDENSGPSAKRYLTRKSTSKWDSTGQSPTVTAAQPTTPAPALDMPLLWNGTGNYSVTSGTCHGNMHKLAVEKAVDTTGFSLKVLYCKQRLPHQVYATFSFDKLEGLMRLCPRDKSSKEKFPVTQFENKCYLSKETVPGCEHRTWAMRWRGTDGGMQLNKVVGGEDISLGTFDFEEESSSPPAEFVGVKITFLMIYNGQLFTFDATKIAELDPREICKKAQPFERRWKSLYNPEWDEDSDSESDSQTDSETETMLRGPRNRPQVAKRPQIPRPKPIVKPPSSSSLSSSEIRPNWAWDLTGSWTVSSDMLKERLDLDHNASLSMKFTLSNGPQSGRQLWATYKFGDAFEGIMRFNPESNHDDHTRDVDEFEKACELRKGVWPGPSPRGQNRWRFRFKGVDGCTKRNVRSDDVCTSSIEFKLGEDGRLSFGAAFTFHFISLALHGVKNAEDASTHEAECAIAPESLEGSWQRMNSRGEEYSGGKEWAESINSPYSRNPPPKMPSRMPREVERSGPGLWKDHHGKTVIENPPDWAWNLAGHWSITSPTLSKALKLGKTERLSMKIHISNYPAHTRVGRQLWASFVFGGGLKGYMRFCPASTPNVKGCNLKEFDSNCKLEEGQWAGPSGDGGHQKWLWRWRANTGFMSYEDGSDEFQDEVEFSRGESGEYIMKAVFTYRYQRVLLEAVKERESTPPRGNPSSILTAWDNCRNKQDSGRYIVSASYGGY